MMLVLPPAVLALCRMARRVGLHPPHGRAEPHARRIWPTVHAPLRIAPRASRSVIAMHRQTYTLAPQRPGEHLPDLVSRGRDVFLWCSGINGAREPIVRIVDRRHSIG
jgi:hypothetical protein